MVIRCCRPPSSCTQPTCTAGWLYSSCLFWSNVSSATLHRRIASHPHRLSECLSACLPIYLTPSCWLLLPPASLSFSRPIRDLHLTVFSVYQPVSQSASFL